MKLTNRLALATLAGLTALGGLAATPAAARSSVSIEYRDGNYRDRDYRDYDRYRDRRDHRDWRAYDRGYHYGRDRDRDRCWTEWQWDGWRRERVPVRVCR